MGVAFDYAPDRSEHIEAILNGLDRYNPETTSIFQDYVTQQCEDRTYDCYANLALLKLYQFNPHLLHPDTVTAILTKSLTVHPSPDFSLCLHLLPAHTTSPNPTNPTSNGNLDPLTDAIHKLTLLNTHLESAAYRAFWTTLDSDDLYADLIADVSGFEELMRVRIAVAVGQACREVDRGVLEGWLGYAAGRGGGGFEQFVQGVCGWGIEGGVVRVPVNKENEAKGTVVREEVRFEGFGRVVRRAFEEPA